MYAPNLPTQPTAFVGRTQELSEIAASFDDPACRLLTLIGPGGIGKTRLALEAAAAQLPNYPDNVFFVALQALTSSEGIVSTIASAVSLQLYAGSEPQQQLIDYLRDKRLLLVLDNFEHLLDGVDIISDVLAHAPHIGIIATSREALNLQEEWLFVVKGMDYPAETAVNPDDFSAVKLFSQRAKQMRIDFSAVQEQVGITRICQIVGGIPLGLELAAAWVRTLSCAEIADEIQRSLDILETSTRNVEPRHRTMRAAFEPTYNRLSNDERKLFMRLSVFRGGFSREAAAEIAGASLRTLSELVNKSLLRVMDDGRYDLHELLRQYAEEQLNAAPDEMTAVHDRHCDYYLQKLDVFVLYWGEKPYVAANEIERWLENVRAAWTWAVEVENNRLDIIQQSTHGLLRFNYMRNHWQEALVDFQMLADALAAYADSSAQARSVYVEALVWLGFLNLRLGELTTARDILEGCLHLDVGLKKPPGTIGSPIDPRCPLSMVYSILGDYNRAIRLGEGARQMAEENHDYSTLTFAYYALTGAYSAQGNWPEALKCARSALENGALVNDRWMMAYCYNELGSIARTLGDYTEARQHYQASYAIREEYNDPEGMGVALNLLAELAVLQQDYQAARELYQRSLTIYEMGDKGFLSNAYRGLGNVASALGEYAEARHAFYRALRLTHEGQLITFSLSILVSIAELFASMGEAEKALELLTLVVQHPTSKQETREKAVSILHQLQARLSPERFAAENSQQPLDSMITQTLADLSQPLPASSGKGASAQALLDPLTERELEILNLIAAGFSNRRIADDLVLSLGTVKWYVNQIFSKLYVGSRTQALVRARELNLLQ